MRYNQRFPPEPPRPTLYLGPPLNDPPPSRLYADSSKVPGLYPRSGITAIAESCGEAASASLDPNETSLPERPVLSYNDLCRYRDRIEWDCVRQTLRSLHPVVSDKRLYRYDRCLDRAYFYRNKDDGKVAVFSAACRDRFCPVCGARRSYDVARKVKEWIAAHHDVRFATFTLRSSEVPLEDQISALYQNFSRVRRNPMVRRSLAAGIWFFQATFNGVSGRWHPHLHCVTVGAWVDQSKLSEAWLQASGDSYVVDIRFVHDPQKVADYVSRYAARPFRLADLPGDRRQEAVLAFWSRRLFGCWGKLESRPKIKRPKADLSKWECVGSWSYVVTLQSCDWRAASIMLAWQSRTPLEPDVSIYEIDHAVQHSWVTEVWIDPPPPE